MIEWMKIKKEIQYFVAAILTCLILLLVSSYYHRSYEVDWQTENRHLIQNKVKYQQSKDRVKLLEEYENQFNKLKDKGIYGEEQRIHWIETIQSSTEKRKIPSVKFEIAEQIKLDRNNMDGDFSSVDIYFSKMNIDFKLLHEGDLFGLLQDLDNHAHGLNAVSQCHIRNNFSELTSVIDSNSFANFSGNCQLYWFTMDEEKADFNEEDS